VGKAESCLAEAAVSGQSRELPGCSTTFEVAAACSSRALADRCFDADKNVHADGSSESRGPPPQSPHTHNYILSL
jgi:hypothetical protein